MLARLAQHNPAEYEGWTFQRLAEVLAEASQGRLTGYRVGPRLVKVDLKEWEALARPIPTARAARP